MQRPVHGPVILFLQGPPSVFWRELAEAFEKVGVPTHRVNFSLGDQIYWLKRGAINYRRSLKHWPVFLEKLIRREKITDILYYADQLPYHKIACEVGARLGVRCHAVEFGYLRPDWITLERDGMGHLSHFPNDPAAVRAIAGNVGVPDLHVRYPHTFGQEAFNEVFYNITAFFGRAFFPLYVADKYYSALVDYLPWLVRWAHRPRTTPPELFENGHVPFFIVALQLQSDYQIRANSPYQHLEEMLDEVIASFATHAAADHTLVFKQHPLDNGLERWGKRIARIAEKYDVSERVMFIEQGNLDAILRQSSGTVVVNSTVGIHSIRKLKPTIALGCAVYDIPGLTHQGSLDAFWTNPEPVDEQLLHDFIAALAATIQVKGSFYNKEGRRVGTAEVVQRVIEARVNEPGAFVDPAPRIGSPKASQRQ